jgi:CubicO group peptidase (beta-lactamase class C family)
LTRLLRFRTLHVVNGERGRCDIALAKRLVGILLLGALAATVRAEDAQTVVRGEEGARLLAAVERVRDDARAVSVSVLREGRPILRMAFGLTSLKTGERATLQTLYDTGSVSKQFTAAGILMLVQAGKIALDDPVRKHFPDPPEVRAGITIAHLLHHTSGFDPRSAGSTGRARSPDDVAKIVLGWKASSPPGKTFAYSNPGYCLLAALIEKASGRSFEATMKETVFRPAGLARTGFCQDTDLPRDLSAKRYGGLEGKQEIGSASHYAWGWGFRGCTGVVTSILDLERWVGVLASDGLLTAESRKMLFTPGPGGYALGWFVARGPGGTVCRHHGGSSQGFSAHVALYPEKKVSILVLCARQGLAGKLHAVLEKAVLGDAPVEAEVKVDRSILARYAGGYNFMDRGGIEARVDSDGALSLVGVGQEVFSRLYYGSAFKPQWLGLFERVNARAKFRVPVLEKGDAEAAKAAFNSPAVVAAGLAAFGRPERWEILGTDTGKDGMHTYLRAWSSGKPYGVTLDWGKGQRLDRVSRTEDVHPFPMRLRARTPTEFEGKAAFGRGVLRVRFAPDGSRLEILEPDGPGSKPILCPRR